MMTGFRHPKEDRCCCWIHQDTPRGIIVKVCSRHDKDCVARLLGHHRGDAACCGGCGVRRGNVHEGPAAA